MCSGSEAGSYLRLPDCVHHSTLGWRVTRKKQKDEGLEFRCRRLMFGGVGFGLRV